MAKTLTIKKLADEKSGKFIIRVIKMNRFTDREIVDLVHANFKESKALRGDVAWNRQKLWHDEGLDIPARREPRAEKPVAAKKVAKKVTKRTKKAPTTTESETEQAAA